jgi:hypothetical protein
MESLFHPFATFPWMDGHPTHLLAAGVLGLLTAIQVTTLSSSPILLSSQPVTNRTILPDQKICAVESCLGA